MRMSRGYTDSMVLFAVGTELAAAVVGGAWLGVYVDERFGISPIGLMLGVITGLGGGLVLLLQTLKRVQARQQQDESADGTED